MSPKQNLALLFGGKNTEHEISILTATSVFKNLDQSKYEIKLIYINKNGVWNIVDDFDSIAIIKDASDLKGDLSQAIELFNSQNFIAFPLIHGKYGEDGTLQGMLEMLGVKYIGCGVLASALAMDKSVAKIIFDSIGLKTARSLTFESFESKDLIFVKIVKEFKFPVFIKPARQGSSVGISKVYDHKSLLNAVKEAFEFDSKILVQEYILGREVECAVLGKDDDIQASEIGEIRPKTDFYSYKTKYTDGQADLIIPADLDEDVRSELQRQAKMAFKTLGCKDLARVDFFLTSENEIYINEINTLPGFTSLSMYPMLWGASGLSYGELLDKLIRLGLN